MRITKAFIDNIRSLIASARTTVARGINLVQVHTNFEIGRRIIEQEQRGKDRAAYGKEILDALAERLTDEFGKGVFEEQSRIHAEVFCALQRSRGNFPIIDWEIGKTP